MLFIAVWIMILGTSAKMTTTTGDSSSNSNNISTQLISEDGVPVALLIPNISAIPNTDELRLKFADVVKSPGEIHLKDNVRQEPPTLVKSGNDFVHDDWVDEESEKLNDDEVSGNKQEKGVTKKEEAELKGEVVVQKARDKIEETEISENKNAKIIQKTEILINSDAIKKEESELVAEAGDALAVEAEHDKKQEELKKTLEQHKIEQRQMLQEQKDIINTLEQREQELEREKKEKEASKKAAIGVDHDRATNVDKVLIRIIMILMKSTENIPMTSKLQIDLLTHRNLKLTMNKHSGVSVEQTESPLAVGGNPSMKKSQDPILSDLTKPPKSGHNKEGEELRKILEQHRMEQIQMLQEQKEIINSLKQQIQ